MSPNCDLEDTMNRSHGAALLTGLLLMAPVANADEEVVCEETGGSWTTCGSGCGPATCENPEPGGICPAVCMLMCECPAEKPIWDGDNGCIPLAKCGAETPEMALCSATGGDWTECGPGCGPATCENPSFPGPCPPVCLIMCVCPADAPLWHPEDGCIAEAACSGESQPGPALCQSTGGSWTASPPVKQTGVCQ